MADDIDVLFLNPLTYSIEWLSELKATEVIHWSFLMCNFKLPFIQILKIRQ